MRALGVQRFDLLQICRKLVLGTLQVVLSLHAHPEARRGPEVAGEPKRGIGSHRGFLASQTLDARTRHAHGL